MVKTMKVLALALATALLVVSNTHAYAQRERDDPAVDWENDRYSYDNTRQMPGELGTLTVMAELTQVDIRNVKATPIHAVAVCERASPNLFGNPKSFRHLSEVFLECETSNSVHLQQLVQNYPNLQSLFITQQNQFSKNDLELLKSFQGLRVLALECPIEDPTSLAMYVPPRLQRLYIDGSNVAEAEPAIWFNLPNLVDLKIRNCKLSSEFFRKLNCPNLEHLEIENVRVTGTTLGRVPRFPSLARVDIRRTAMETTILDEISNLPDIRISEMMSANVRGDATCLAEGHLVKR